MKKALTFLLVFLGFINFSCKYDNSVDPKNESYAINEKDGSSTTLFTTRMIIIQDPGKRSIFLVDTTFTTSQIGYVCPARDFYTMDYSTSTFDIYCYFYWQDYTEYTSQGYWEIRSPNWPYSVIWNKSITITNQVPTGYVDEYCSNISGLQPNSHYQFRCGMSILTGDEKK